MTLKLADAFEGRSARYPTAALVSSAIGRCNRARLFAGGVFFQRAFPVRIIVPPSVPRPSCEVRYDLRRE